MRYIDKKVNLEEGNSYSSDFLYDSFNEEEQCFYPNIVSKQSYQSFSHPKYRYGIKLNGNRSGFEPLLVKEQNNYCCYCMGKIESHDVALEHVIPENFDKMQCPADEFRYYTDYVPILADNVELANEFSKRSFSSKEEIRKIKKYPHLISYANIVASCHGIIDKQDGTSCFCNHPRGNKRIIPLMLMDEASSIVNYNEIGLIIISLENRKEVEDTIAALQLNNDTLQEIRTLWYKISRTSKTVTDIISIDNLKDKITLLKEIFGIADYTKLEDRWKSYAPISKPGTMQQETVYWNLFIKYEWFYEYYKTHYPVQND